MASNAKLFNRRKQRVRTQLRKYNTDRPRLSVHRTSKHIYVQIIDDAAGKTVAAASTLESALKAKTLTLPIAWLVLLVETSLVTSTA